MLSYYYEDESGILNVKHPPNFSQDDIESNLKYLRDNFKDHKKLYLLNDLTDVVIKYNPNTVAIDFSEIVALTKSYLGHFDIIVSAVVTNQEHSKPILEFYSKLANNTDNYLHKVFNNIDEGKHWLTQEKSQS